MKLYYMPGACSLTDHIVLEWTGAHYEAVRMAREDLQSDAYRKINPDGQVPTLVDDDGWVLTQNMAILHYLAEKYPDARLAGTDARSRAEVNRWLGYVNSDVHQSFKPLFGPGAFLADPAQHDDLKQHARQRLSRVFASANTQLARHPWLAGEQRSIADPYLFVVLRWAHAQNVPLDGLAGLDAFFSRMREEPGVRKAMAEEGID